MKPKYNQKSSLPFNSTRSVIPLEEHIAKLCHYGVIPDSSTPTHEASPTQDSVELHVSTEEIHRTFDEWYTYVGFQDEHVGLTQDQLVVPEESFESSQEAPVIALPLDMWRPQEHPLFPTHL